jgi:transposase-like protein
VVIVWKVHDVQDALKAVLADTLQAMLDSELDTHLGYDKYAIQQKQTTNSRNGHSRKSQYGGVELAVPRGPRGHVYPDRGTQASNRDGGDRRSDYRPAITKRG